MSGQHWYLTLYWGKGECTGLAPLLQLHEEVVDVIIEAVGTGQAQAKAAAVQRRHTLTLHTL
jgi:hypothetical protein